MKKTYQFQSKSFVCFINENVKESFFSIQLFQVRLKVSLLHLKLTSPQIFKGTQNFLKMINPIFSRYSAIYRYIIFAQSQDSSQNSLKIAEIIPIHKKGDPSRLTNFCLVSILSQSDKILEKLTNNRPYKFLTKKIFLSDNEFELIIKLIKSNYQYNQ